MNQRFLLCLAAIALALPGISQSGQACKYFRAGNPADSTQSNPAPGYALMGGGSDLDEAFEWLCDRAGGGDFLVLRATGGDDYNPYIEKLCPKLNSVATLIIPSRAAGEDPFVVSTIRAAEAVFIAGGDQANYINFWMRSPVQDAINEDIARGVPLGGTSAGLAVMGEWAYSAQVDKPDDPNLSGKLAMSDPFGPRITLVQGFLRIPTLNGIITDTHFARRDRMGRLLVFLARLNEPDGKPLSPPSPRYRGIGVEEGAAVLLERDGSARVIGRGGAHFIDTSMAFGMLAGGDFGVMASHKPMTFGPYGVQKVTPGHAFNLKTWTGDSTTYQLTVKNGQITSMQHGGVIY
jgi:cyanophycinase